MKTQILLIAMISISFQTLTVTQFCDCTEIVYQADCKGGCTWTASSSSCAATTVDCTKYTDQPTCDSYSKCAWTDSTSKCAAFTACADYTVSVPAQCSGKDSTCVAGTTGTDGKTPCKTGSISCSDFQNSSDCNYKSPSDTTMCWFKASTCTSYDVSKCSGITDADVCATMCKWGTACSAYTCADMPTSDTCRQVATDDFSGITICNWNATSGKCEELADATTLTSSNCFDRTMGGYSWDGSACSQCSGSSSNGYILAFIGFIVMVMF